MESINVEIVTAAIRLDGLLKFSGLAGTGGEAKHLIQSGHIRLNGTIEVRRSTRVVPGDRVELLDVEGRVHTLLEVRPGS
ncbi:MAG: RNA-binding S4 domain-containing protein [Candidatus Eisenbacteria sp.]|nr:RNA-binding S4 domain-containing protein [Candidatus Eisenbacteria bacterium]